MKMVKFLRIFVLAALLTMCVSAAFAEEQEDNPRLLTGNQAYEIPTGGQTGIRAYQIDAFNPLAFEVKGPGKLTLIFYKNYAASRKEGVPEKSSFTVFMNRSLFETVQIAAPVSGMFYKESADIMPGRPERREFELKEGTFSYNILLSPDADRGGAVSWMFKAPEPAEAEVIPLVPLVPLAPVATQQPAQTAPQQQPKEEPKPVAKEEPKPVAKEEPKPAEEPKKDEALPPPSVEQIPQGEQPVAEEKAEEDKKSGKIYVMLEPRLGVNLAMQSVKSEGKTSFETNPAFTAGFAARYVLPVWSQRLRLGLSVDWHSYSFSQTSGSGTTQERGIDVTLTSLPLMAEFEIFILPTGIFRPYVGVGAGGAFVNMDYKSVPKDTTLDTVKVDSKKWTYAFEVLAGLQFNVWQGGPFIQARYLISRATYSSSEGYDYLTAA